MIIGTIYVVFFSTNFIGPFEGFLITLGVPIAAWCGVMLADIALRRRAYSEADLFSSRGRYGVVRWVPVGLMVLGSVLGFRARRQHFRGLAVLAGVPARAVRPRRQDRRVGVRQPRRDRPRLWSRSSAGWCWAAPRSGGRKARPRRPAPRRSERVAERPGTRA